MKKIMAFICLFIYITSSSGLKAYAGSINTAPAWPEGPSVHAEAAIVMESSTGLILYEKNIHETYYPASITKIMTALLALENSSLSEIVTFSRDAVFKVDLDSSRIGIDVGEQLTMQQCLYAILLESANEVSYAVGEHVGGTIENFSKMMNDRARELGCMHTHFVNPHGLHDENHYTTAYDMALIMREALKNETFRKIIATRTYKIPPTNIQKETRYLANHHKFILKQDYFYDDCIGGKTGYTSKSKYNLVSAALRGDMEIISVVMRDDTSEHQYMDTKKLLDFGFDNFAIYPIADIEDSNVLPESPFFTLYNPMLSKTDTAIRIDDKGYLVLPKSASFSDAIRDVSFYESSVASGKDSIIGKISYTYNGKFVGGADILYIDSQRPSLIGKDIDLRTSAPSRTDDESISSPAAEPMQEKSGGSLRPVIIAVIVGILVLLVGLYFVLVERPRLKRRSEYYRKRALRKAMSDDDYLDL